MKYNQKVIDFFKRHNMYDEKVFEYLQDNTMMVDYNDPDQRMFIGFSAWIKDGVLKRFTICIPYMQDNITMLNDIHEIAHGIYAYRKLNKKYDRNACETIPMLCEKIFVSETNDEELTKYSEYLDSLIDEDSEAKYRFALRNRDIIYNEFNDDYEIAERLCDKLAKREAIKKMLSKYFKS